MSTAVDRMLQAHPRAGPLWYRLLARATGRVLLLPGLRRWRPVARRAHAVTRPAGRVTVLEEPGAPRPAPGTGVTVLSANLWHDWPRHQRWPERLEAFARLVDSVDADVLLLQEVARTPALAADGWLAERLGCSMAYARANGDVEAIGFEEGPAILSRFPLRRVRVRQLTHGHNPLVRRVALAAHVQTPDGPLLVVSAHLGLWQRHNAGQILRLREWVTDVSAGETAVVGGDFNAPEHAPEIARTSREWADTFRLAHPDADATTHTRDSPGRSVLHRRLDYIFVQQAPAAPWAVLEAAHLHAPDGPHSDHLAVLARLAPVARTPGADSAR